MAALHGSGILRIERAALLVDHDAVFTQSIIAASVKFAGEKPLGRAERVGGIDDDEVVLIFTLANELQRVFVVDMYTAVVHAAGVARQVGAAGLDDLRVHLDEVDALYAVVASQFAYDAAVARADDENVLCIAVHGHRHMGDHFVVDKLVALREHDIAVQRQHAAELRRFKNIDALIGALL